VIKILCSGITYFAPQLVYTTTIKVDDSLNICSHWRFYCFRVFRARKYYSHLVV